MTDDELGKMFFEYTNRNWPEPKMKWERLSGGARYLWTKRAMQKQPSFYDRIGRENGKDN